jgi:hypothetical protein
MLLAATAPALLMLVLTLGLAALSMLETTPQPRTSLRSSAPVTVSQAQPAPLERKTVPTVSSVSADGPEVVHRAAATGARPHAASSRHAGAYAPDRSGHRPRPTHPPASRGVTSPLRTGASPIR